MKERSLTRLYIKRSFTKNLKKQLFLIMGIAAFMVMAVIQIVSSDSNSNKVYKSVESQHWGYDIKVIDLTKEQQNTFLEQKEISKSCVVKYFDITAGLTEANLLISADFPDTFRIKYLYGEAPKQGEVAFPENARIGGKRPKTGQTVTIEIQVGEEKKMVTANVSGVYEEHGMYNSGCVAMCPDDFDILVAESGLGEQCPTYLLLDCGGMEAAQELSIRMANLFDTFFRLEGQGGANENLSNWTYVDTIAQNLYISILVGAVSMIAIIYIVLKDEQKTLGIFRALGATRRQMLGILTARMAVLALLGAMVGTIFGGVILLLKEVLLAEKTGYEPTYISFVMIPFAAVLFFVLFQIPAALIVLRKSEVELMRGEEVRGKRLISYKNKRLHKCKRPLWWYSGLETKRIKGTVIVLCLVTASSLMYIVASLLLTDYRIEGNAVDALETDYSVTKSGGNFTKEELDEIKRIGGVTIGEYGVQFFEENLVTWKEWNLCAKVEIIEEISFQEFKVAQARKPLLPRFKGTLEEALAGGRVLVEPTYRMTMQTQMLAGDTIYIRNVQGEMVPYELATVGAAKVDNSCDCYIYVSYDTYEALFGTPEISKFHVVLDGTDYKTVQKSVEGMSKLYSFEENEIILGYSERQLRKDAIVVLMEEVMISVLISFSFLICYYSFYFLSKKEEYWMLYAQGASKRMLQKIVLCQAFRMAFWSALVTGIAATVLAVTSKDAEAAKLEGLAEPELLWWMLPVGMALIILVSMSATWLASKGMLKDLEKKAE